MTYLDADAASAATSGGLNIREMTFTEVGAGTYTGAVTVPGGSTVLDIQVVAVALWDAVTSASLQVGDADDPDGYYTAVDLKATDLTLDQGIRFSLQGGVGGAYMVATHTTNVYQATDRVITATVASVGAGTLGRTRVLVIYATPPTPAASVFVAA